MSADLTDIHMSPWIQNDFFYLEWIKFYITYKRGQVVSPPLAGEVARDRQDNMTYDTQTTKRSTAKS